NARHPAPSAGGTPGTAPRGRARTRRSRRHRATAERARSSSRRRRCAGRRRTAGRSAGSPSVRAAAGGRARPPSRAAGPGGPWRVREEEEADALIVVAPPARGEGVKDVRAIVSRRAPPLVEPEDGPDPEIPALRSARVLEQRPERRPVHQPALVVARVAEERP